METKEIIGTFLHEIRRFSNNRGGCMLLGLLESGDDTLKLKCYLDPGEDAPEDGKSYRLFGDYELYANQRTGFVETQFKAKSWIETRPAGRYALCEYLSRCEGIGPKTAGKIWDLFEEDAVEAVKRLDPKLESIKGLKLRNLKAAAEKLKISEAMQQVEIECTGLLAKMGFPRSIIKKGLEIYGARFPDRIRKNPYILLSKQFPGAGWLKVDKLYLSLGLPPDRMKRQVYCLVHILRSDKSGDTWHCAKKVTKILYRMIAGADCNPIKAIRIAKKVGLVSVVYSDGHDGRPTIEGDNCWIALRDNSIRERVLARKSAEFCGEPAGWVGLLSHAAELSAHQLDRARAATSGGQLAILGGSPGTGKTFVASRMIRSAIQAYTEAEVAVAAPTGKAAVRITESMQGCGLNVRAKTIHSLLKVVKIDSDGEWEFYHGEKNPLPFSLIVCDECFPAGTFVDTPFGMRPIDQIKPGDTIFNASGEDTVIATARKQAKRAVKVTAGKTSFICSENHPVFTARGYVRAGDLEHGDSLVQTATAMRLLRGDDHSEEVRASAFLQREMQCEVVDAVRQPQGQGVYGRSQCEVRSKAEGVSRGGITGSQVANSANCGLESNAAQVIASKDGSYASQDGPQAASAGRQWTRHNGASEDSDGTSRAGLESRACRVDRKTNAGNAHSLQDRPGKPADNDRNRVRRIIPQLEDRKGEGREERPIPGFVRVDRVEVLESGNPELERLRDVDGELYFYDLQAARHPSFSVEGFLVHNCSMVDTSLLCSLFRARGYATKILLVGDVNQLPPVGNGAPLRDLIAAGVPYGEFKDILRNSGQIVLACRAIRYAEDFESSDLANGFLVRGENNLAYLKPEEGEWLEAIHNAIRFFARHDESVKPAWDVQVLVAVNDRSEVSRKTVNKHLQAALNSGNEQNTIEGSPFWMDDKVVCLANSYFPEVAPGERYINADIHREEVRGLGKGNTSILEVVRNADGAIYVANGEIGRIYGIEANRFMVHLESPRRNIVVPRGKPDVGEEQSSSSARCRWDLAYALSTHKSQGSEWPYVVVVADESGAARRVCSREWIYTALSRAKVGCIVVGRHETVRDYSRRQAIHKRKTFLKQWVEIDREFYERKSIEMEPSDKVEK